MELIFILFLSIGLPSLLLAFLLKPKGMQFEKAMNDPERIRAEINSIRGRS